MKKKRFFLLWFILPAAVLYITFVAIPVLSTFYYGFFEGDKIIPTEFVGWGNYIKLFTQYPYIKRYLNALKNNIILYLIIFVLQNIGGMVIAFIVARKFKGNKFFRRITYLPATISIILTAYIWKMMINNLDLINKGLEFLHLGFLQRYWLNDTSTALAMAGIITIWHAIGYTILLYAAGLDSIPDELIDAAKIDGTNELGLIRYIKLPLLIPVIKLVIILNFISSFARNFEVIFATQGIQAGPRFSTDTLGTLYYRASFSHPTLGGWGSGMGSAMGSVNFIFIGAIVLLLFLFFNRLERNVL